MNGCFPEYCVKQVLSEYKYERGDEHVIRMMQNELLPQIVMELIKGCVTSAIISKRKIINDTDIDNALKTSLFSTTTALQKNHILDARYFPSFVSECLEVYILMLKKCGISIDTNPKFSGTSLSLFQKVCESCIRTFVSKLSPYHNNLVNIKSFQKSIHDITGDLGTDGYIAYSTGIN